MTTATADSQPELPALTGENGALQEEVVTKLAEVVTLNANLSKRFAEIIAVRDEISREVAAASALTITDDTTYEQAAKAFLRLGGLETRAGAVWEPFTAPANKLHKSFTSRRKEMVDKAVGERDRLNKAIAAWDAEQERLQRERELAAAIEEKKRQDAIAAEQAALLEVQGHAELAGAVIQQAIETPAPPVSLGRAVPKVQGLSYRTVYEHEVINLALVPREWLCVDDAKVKKYHEAMKEAARIPGIVFTSRDVPVGRSAWRDTRDRQQIRT